ncbi:PIR Superfamily Protein [Plasmodium ovale curtisi]|uniref:PIR Superfamily Protein n=1 Tax=Plasmodium ovale curtisi TaxID=864141 RepID=A0A1A8WPT3_PLAOA|nr:PIR Superfamily Protein [Plasmodium ovale curtisi]
MEKKRADVLKKLDPFMFDFMLNNPVTLCKKCKLCDDVNEMKKNEPWFKFLCYQLVRNLETAETINSSNPVDKKLSRCKSLTYWLYDRVKNIYEQSEINNKEKLDEKLLRVWTNFYKSYAGKVPSSACSVPAVSEFKNLENMKRKKIMSDYCENYHKLRKILKIYETYDDAHIYYDYFRHSLKTYRNIVGECNTEDFIIEDCSKFCSNYDPDDLLNTAKFRTIEISPGNNDYIEKGKCDILRDDAVAAKTCESREVRISEFTFSDNRAIILILFSFWGIFLTFLFLYKMIPLRSWISNKLGKKIIIRDKFNEQSDNELFDDDYESVDGNIQSTGYNLTYNSDWSSSR